MTIQIHRPIIKSKWHYVLHTLFDHPSIVLIGGIWKSGKTDFALFIAQCLLKLQFKSTRHVIEEMASNIETGGHFPYIYDLVSLRRWLYATPKRKLYILDEANEHMPSRRAMSGKNVGFIRLIPEISKAHARMIVVGQELLDLDKTFRGDTWCRGFFIKLGLKKAQCFAQRLPQPFLFKNIPPTSISFDPYTIAPFQEQPSGKTMFKDEDLQMLWEWSNGKPCQALGLLPTQLNRKVRRYVKETLENEHNV